MRFFILTMFCLLLINCDAQNTLGLPTILNFTTGQYHAGTQNWCIDQDYSGTMYFANNNGLLTFDGSNWSLYPIPNKSNLRSLAVNNDGKIFAGAQDEIGYFFPNANGVLTYHSLKDLIPATDRLFADVWNIEILPEGIFFRAANKIFRYAKNKITVYRAPAEWRVMAKAGTRLFAQDAGLGLLEFKNGNWEVYNNKFDSRNRIITGIETYNKDTLLVSTLKGGLYLLKEASIQPLRIPAAIAGEHIYCLNSIDSNYYVLGTTSSGSYIINKKAEIVQQFSKTEGFQNNNILYSFTDRHKNLWFGCDNGIQYAAYNSPVKYIYADNINQNTGYAANIFNHNLYVGTSNGLFCAPLENLSGDLSFVKGSFSKVQYTEGQVWSLKAISNQLIMGHHEGTFTVTPRVATNIASGINPNVGFWRYEVLDSNSKRVLIVAGCYNGLQLLSLENGIVKVLPRPDGMNESFRFLEIDSNGVIWTSHPYRGVFKIKLSEDLKSYSTKIYINKNGLPGNLGNYVYRLNNKIVIASEKGLYAYNAKLDRFEPLNSRENIFSHSPIEYLKEDNDKNIWFTQNNKLGVAVYDAQLHTYTTQYFPELTGKVLLGFQNIYYYNSKNVFIGSDKGMIHINFDSYRKDNPDLNISIRSVTTINSTNDSLIFGGYFSDNDSIIHHQSKKIPELAHAWSSFHFTFSAPLFDRNESVLYAYKLENFDAGWSSWSAKNEKDYTNLPYGHYTFKVRAKTANIQAVETAYSFVILPAWYQTNLAYTFYVLLIVVIIYFVVKHQQHKFKLQQLKHIEEQEQLKYLHQLEVENSEKEIVRLKNENLHAEVSFKNKELATTTMHLVQRGKLLARLKDELTGLQKTVKPGMEKDFKKIIALLNSAERSDADWDQFSIHFDQVHSNFLAGIKEKHSNLSPSDIKLCAYLKMNLSSKEIAQLMSISVRGVEISRYRLRKKLNIGSEVNLVDFILTVSAE